MRNAFIRQMEAKCDTDDSERKKKLVGLCQISLPIFVYFLLILEKGNTNAPWQLRTCEALQGVSQNVSRLKTSRSVMCSGNAIFVDVVTHEWKWQFVYYSMHTRLAMVAMRLETGGIPLQHN